MRITARYTFAAAHRLVDPSIPPEENERLFGPCARLHGHTYRLDVSLAGDTLAHGMLANFVDIDGIVREHVIDRLDHRCVEEIPRFRDVPSTAEEMARWIWRELAPHFAGGPARLAEITLWEGDRHSATVDRDE